MLVEPPPGVMATRTWPRAPGDRGVRDRREPEPGGGGTPRGWTIRGARRSRELHATRVAEHQAMGAGPRLARAHHDVLADQARFDAARHMEDAAALQHDR